MIQIRMISPESNMLNKNKWQIAFDSSAEKGVHYLTNSNTQLQYKWTGSEWIKSYEGEYKAGDWSIVL